MTDNDSAKLATGKGVIQGYTGAAAVDASHQIIRGGRSARLGFRAEPAAAPKSTGGGKFKPQDFSFDAKNNSCICPAGKTLYSNASHCTTKGRTHHKFTGAKRDCVPCKLRDQCLRTPEKTPVRQVAFFQPNASSPLTYTEAMRQRIDSVAGRALYGRRIATVEPVFGNLRNNKRTNPAL